MSDNDSFASFATAMAFGASPADDVGVRFPPGLGLIPPRDVPRLRKGRADVQA